LPKNVDFSIIDHFEKVTDKDAAVMTRRIPREEGIFVGNSAGSAMAGIMQMRHMFKKDDVVVVIFHDHGTRYLGKMFNDDWMRDRGFLINDQPKAIELIERHKHLKLVTVNESEVIHDVVTRMRKYDISQIPVVNDAGEFIGSLNDSHLFSQLIEHPELKSDKVQKVIQAPFPFVHHEATLDEVSKLITKENNAVMVKSLGGDIHIITKQDVIDAVA
jgi:cystathionine beta-synthase